MYFNSIIYAMTLQSMCTWLVLLFKWWWCVSGAPRRWFFPVYRIQRWKCLRTVKEAGAFNTSLSSWVWLIKHLLQTDVLWCGGILQKDGKVVACCDRLDQNQGTFRRQSWFSPTFINHEIFVSPSELMVCFHLYFVQLHLDFEQVISVLANTCGICLLQQAFMWDYQTFVQGFYSFQYKQQSSSQLSWRIHPSVNSSLPSSRSS